MAEVAARVDRFYAYGLGARAGTLRVGISRAQSHALTGALWLRFRLSRRGIRATRRTDLGNEPLVGYVERRRQWLVGDVLVVPLVAVVVIFEARERRRKARKRPPVLERENRSLRLLTREWRPPTTSWP